MLKPDVLLVNPGGRKKIYQKLANEFAAKEPPLWIGLIAYYLKKKGWWVEVLDADVNNLSPEEVGKAVADINPLLTAIVVYGQNPTASTPKMVGASPTAKYIKQHCPETKIIFLGLHPSALPERTLLEEETDFVCQGEGPYTLDELLTVLKTKGDIKKVKGLWFKKGGKAVFTSPAPLISNLDVEIPIMAYELLPMDKYVAHNWHCFDDLSKRTPYGIIYTSLGCPFSCFYCPINAVFGRKGIRFLGIDNVVKQIEILVERYGIKNIKIVDELFVLNSKRIKEFWKRLKERNYDLNIWAYARVDTVNDEILHMLRDSGVKWLCYGFESASEKVRKKVDKKTEDEQILEAIHLTRRNDINIIGNFLFGLPDDTIHSMQETLNFAFHHNFEYVNFYVAMAYPGSRLYDYALKQGWQIPDSWEAYAQLSKKTTPLPTLYLSPGEVLKFRDKAFFLYFSRKEYLDHIRRKFGRDVIDHLSRMLNTRIERELYENKCT